MSNVFNDFSLRRQVSDFLTTATSLMLSIKTLVLEKITTEKMTQAALREAEVARMDTRNR